MLTEFNPRIFSSEPIEEDYNVKKQIVRYSKAREEKQKRERVSSLQRKEEKGMRFDNEVKKGKESFDKFNKRIPIKKKKIKEPLLTFEIKIRNKVEILNYFEGEDIEEVANFKNYYIVDNERPKLCADRLDGVVLNSIGWTKNITQEELASTLNTTHSTISAYESGKTTILTAFAYDICKRYNIYMDYLCARILI